MDRLHEWDICLSNWLAKKLVHLKVTYLSVRPLVCGWYGDVTLWLVPARVRIFSISALQNSRPWSLITILGKPYLELDKDIQNYNILVCVVRRRYGKLLPVGKRLNLLMMVGHKM